MNLYLKCSDFPKSGCCGSCHTDYEEYGYSLFNVEDDSSCEVCCEVSSWIDKNPEEARAIVNEAISRQIREQHE